ncbi:MAG TPA: Ig-like domain-containing protein, partial [Cyclobacteriaceae bacterium]|nr:Ig-like domain-containing protein [Cyclobacteriaceae bacterium]
MKRLVTLFTMLAFVSVMVIFNSCKKEEDPVALVLAALIANDTDLNAATAPTGVDLDAVITAEFSTDVDASTAIAANITLLREYDDANVDITITASGTTVTITPADPLGTGTQYTLTFTTGLKSSEGEFLAANVARSFTTEGTFAVPGAIAQWTFENSANDVVGGFNPTGSGVVDITYSAGRNDASGMAATFNGTTSIIEIPNGDQLENTDDFALSFWVYADTTDKTTGYFVLGLGAFFGFQFEIFGGLGGCKLAATYNVGDTATTGEDLWCDATGNLGW